MWNEQAVASPLFRLHTIVEHVSTRKGADVVAAKKVHLTWFAFDAVVVTIVVGSFCKVLICIFRTDCYNLPVGKQFYVYSLDPSAIGTIRTGITARGVTAICLVHPTIFADPIIMKRREFDVQVHEAIVLAELFRWRRLRRGRRGRRWRRVGWE